MAELKPFLLRHGVPCAAGGRSGGATTHVLFRVPKPIADQSWGAIFFCTCLAFIGAVAMYSVAGGSLSPWAMQHMVRFALFLLVALVISYVPVQTYKPLAFLALGGSLLLLIGVLTLGAIKGGARSWLDLGFMQIQPSEFVRIALIMALARFFERLPPIENDNFRSLIPPAILIGVPFLLIAAQPDLGTGMLLLLSSILVVFLAGFPMKWFLGAGAAVIAIIPITFSLLLPHQQKRVTIFLNPQDDPLGAGYHISQSLIALGSGGFTGKGYLQGSQSHLDYLPENHTDFIYSAIVEEWGFVGGMAVILLFAMLFRWGLRVAMQAEKRFDKLFAAGLTFSLFLYCAINLMMVVGLAPVVGIPLPLVSYGGSAMLAAMITIGFIMGIDRNNRRAQSHFGRPY